MRACHKSGLKILVREPSDKKFEELGFWVGHTYCDVWWLWVQFGLEISMYANRNSYQHNLEKSFEPWQTPRWKPSAWLHISSSLSIRYSDFHLPYEPLVLDYIGILRFTLDKVTVTPIHSGRINISFNLVSQNVQWFPLTNGSDNAIHEWVRQCPWLTNILRPA